MSKWVIGKYIRLSDADRDLMKKEGKTESESVSHQKALIQNFVNEHEELKDCEQYEFFDDGFSGTNFDRPSFEKLIEQIAAQEGVTEILKEAQPLEWVGRMNSIRSRVEEIILHEVILTL